MIHQELKLLPKLSIAENVFVGRYPMTVGPRRSQGHGASARAAACSGSGLRHFARPPGRRSFDRPAAADRDRQGADARTRACSSSTSRQPRLAARKPQLLFQQIARLKSEGVGIIYISHRLEEIRQIADRIVVMRDGAKVAEFDSGDVPVRTYR